MEERICSCGTENRAEAVFCKRCGARLGAGVGGGLSALAFVFCLVVFLGLLGTGIFAADEYSWSGDEVAGVAIAVSVAGLLELIALIFIIGAIGRVKMKTVRRPVMAIIGLFLCVVGHLVLAYCLCSAIDGEAGRARWAEREEREAELRCRHAEEQLHQFKQQLQYRTKSYHR